MTDTPLDLSKRYKTRNGLKVHGLHPYTKPGFSHLISGWVETPKGKGLYQWWPNGRMSARQRHPLDLIPCEDE